MAFLILNIEQGILNVEWNQEFEIGNQVSTEILLCCFLFDIQYSLFVIRYS
jgi:hypothetical protein